MLELGVCMDMSGGDSKFKSDPVCALRTMRKGVTLQSNDVMWRQVTISMHSLVEPGKYGLFSRFQTMHSAHPLSLCFHPSDQWRYPGHREKDRQR
jgi:hypothetical protein